MLPQNATAQERALEASTARIGSVETPLRDVWNPDTCPSPLLPWLAWAFGVDEWDAEWSDDAKRNTIRDAVMIQRRKGTVWAVKRTIKNAGYGDSQLQEGNSLSFYNSVRTHNGAVTHGDPSEWARYRFLMARPITNDQAAQVRRLLDSVAPARCHLFELVFTEVPNAYNGATTYNGNFNHGVA